MFKSKISIILILCIVITSLTGCYPERNLVYTDKPFITDIEYKKLIKAEYKTQLATKRNLNYHTIEWYDVSDEKREILFKRTQEELSNLRLKLGYTGLDSEHDYFNFIIDPWQDNGTSKKYSFYKNRSNYYVKVDFNFTGNPNIAEFKKPANYIGIYGGINYDENGNTVVDELYLKTLVDTVNVYRTEHGLDKLDDEIEQINYITDLDEEYLFSDIYIEEVGESTSSEVISDYSAQYETDKNTEDIFKEVQNDEEIAEQRKDTWGRTVRKLAYNAEDFNNIVGISRDYFSVIPSPLAIFLIKDFGKSSNVTQGFSMYDWGSTIKEVVKNNKKSKVSIVFIFQENATGDDMDFLTYYIDNISTLDIAQSSSLKSIPVPEFTQNQLEICVEDFNRAFANKDISRLTSGELILPQDLGLYWLLYRDSIDLSYNDIWIDKVLRQEGNTYLLDVQQITYEIPKGVSGISGKYFRKWYFRVGLDDNKFKVLDVYPHELKVLRIPDLDTTSGSTEKIRALQRQDISGNISDKIKNEVKTELKKLESGLTNRLNSDKFDEKNNILKSDKGIEHWGIKDRFTNDTTILSTDKKQDYISILQNKVLKYGVDVPCKAYVLPLDWVAGNESQVQLTSNILFVYGKDKYADLIEVFIIMNKFDDKWLIDEFTTMSEKVYDKKEDIKYIKSKYNIEE